MNPPARLSPLALVLAALVGVMSGFVTQVLRSQNGYPPLSPPVSLPATLLIIAAVLVILGARLQRALKPETQRPVHPFHAVRLLAGARAAQLTGLLFAGFGVGLLAQLANRAVGVTLEVWLPMLLTMLMGFVLFGAGLYTEHACRIPPQDPETGNDEGEEPEGDRLLA